MTHSFSPRFAIPIALILLAIFVIVAIAVVLNGTVGFDAAIAGLVHDSSGAPIGADWLLETVRDFTSLGSYGLLITVIVIASVVLIAMRRWPLAVYLISVSALGTILSSLLKSAFDRPRPEIAIALKVFTASFPSGHAMMSTVVLVTLAGIVGFLSTNRAVVVIVWWFAVSMAVLVGVSRIYLGVHFPTDVLAGWALGGAWALLCGAVADGMGDRLRQKSGAPLTKS